MKVLVSVLLTTILLAGCLSAPFQPPVGMVSVTTAPLSTEGSWEVGTASGRASSYSVLGLYAYGDCSLAEAARQGGLRKICHVDYEYTNFVGIWQKATVIAYGMPAAEAEERK